MIQLTSTHWGTYRYKTENGKVTALTPFEDDTAPNTIGQGIIDVLDHETRITQPMVRQGWLEGGPGNRHMEKRGSDRFVAIDWDIASQLVGDELQRVIEKHGNQAIYAGSYGWASAGRFHHAQSQIHRFLNVIGGYTKSVNTYSFAAAEVMMPHVIGDFRNYTYNQTSWASVIANTELFVAFGGVPIKNGHIGQGGVGRHIQRKSILAAHENGVKFISISPLKSDMDDGVQATWLPIRPNTDTALIIALCYELLDKQLYDANFLDRCTVGFDKFSEYLCGRHDGVAKTAKWAAAICNISADDIRHLAVRMASHRTMISLSWSLTRQAHGEQPFWAGIVLAAMLGQIGLPGGGFGFGYSATNTVGNNFQRNMPIADLPQGRNPISSFIPVARIADMLEYPGTDFTYNGKTYQYPDIKIIYWAGGNPFHHHQDLRRLRRVWQKPDTVIVNDWCWNASTKHADIVLPTTTTLERSDIAMSPRDNYFVAMQQAQAPVGSAHDDYDILRGIARVMGVEDKFTEGRDAGAWQRWMYDVTRQSMSAFGYELPSYDAFLERGWFKIDELSEPAVILDKFRADPIANKLDTPSGKIEIYSEQVAGFSYEDCPPHPSWLTPPEWLGAIQHRGQLHLLSTQPADKLHSQLDHGSVSRATKINGHEPVLINAEDAAMRGIVDGAIVRVFNQRGACLCGAQLTEDIMPGVLMIATGAWFDPDVDGESGLDCKHGNPNVLTPDRGTSSLAQGPAAHSCLAEIELWTGEPVVVTAFTAPIIVQPEMGTIRSRNA
ncbi:MAG: molybdopterin guanine dinucleotide-containing S/N-oxide reductase [Pseudomonadota bacterium]|nr:molybdopterin guanine dinucleotide-containing S/N-oxide reductase [Pseudomonadota bacterium]